MKPKIIMHTQISLDGRIKGFDNRGSLLPGCRGNSFGCGAVWVQYCFTAFEKYPAETEADFEKIITSPGGPQTNRSHT